MEKHTSSQLTVSERAELLGVDEKKIVEMDRESFEESERELECLQDLILDPASRELLPFIVAIDRDTKHSSGIETMREHRAYQEIIERGVDAIPVLIKALDFSPNLSMLVLGDITQENPIAEEHSGYVRKMVDDWKTWARKQTLNDAKNSK